MITQCWTNGTVTLQYGATKISHNILRIKLYTSDTNVEDIIDEIYIYDNSKHIITSYILPYNTKYWTQGI